MLQCLELPYIFVIPSEETRDPEGVHSWPRSNTQRIQNLDVRDQYLMSTFVCVDALRTDLGYLLVRTDRVECDATPAIRLNRFKNIAMLFQRVLSLEQAARVYSSLAIARALSGSRNASTDHSTFLSLVQVSAQ